MKKIIIILVISIFIFLIINGCSKLDDNELLSTLPQSMTTSTPTEENSEPSPQEDTMNSVTSQGDEQRDIEIEQTQEPDLKQEDGFVFLDEHKDIDITIHERMFIAHLNDVQLNADDYMGATIQIEGMYTYFDYGGESKYHVVYRTGPGCCGDDGFYALEFVYDDVDLEVGDWIEVIGVLDMYIDYGIKYLTLQALSVTKKDARGVEFVTQ